LGKKNGAGNLKTALSYVIVWIAVVVVLIPIVYTIRTSLMSASAVFQMPPQWIFAPTILPYKTLMYKEGFLAIIFHSLAINLGSTMLAMFLALLASYSIVRYRFPFGMSISYAILVMTSIPAVAIAIPLFIIYTGLRLYDTYLGMVLIYTYVPIAFSLYLLWSFLQNIPQATEEAAMIDGCSRLGAFLRITLRLMAPGLAATAILTFMYTWSDYMYALILTSTNWRTIPVAITQYIQPVRGPGSPWGPLAAGSVISIIPVAIFAYFAERYLTRGFAIGGVKG
jgi:multiple sugar transport system permease protein